MDEWHEGLVELERDAKNTAPVLFFVIDNETRAVASMVEAAYLASSGRVVILVVKDYAPSLPSHDEETQNEIKELNIARATLVAVAERAGAFVFSQLEAAIRCVVELYTGTVEGKYNSQMVRPTFLDPLALFRYGRALQLLSNAYADLFSPSMSPWTRSHVPLPTCKAAVKEVLKNLAKGDDRMLIKEYKVVQKAAPKLSYNVFCILASEYYTANEVVAALTLNPLIDMCLPERMLEPGSDGMHVTDNSPTVYVGGAQGTMKWRDDHLLPVLAREKITHYDCPVSQLYYSS